MSNHLFYGDNLAVLRDSIADESVDLIYLDPPFNSNASYNVLFKGPSGNESAAQIEAFDDTWHWNESAEQAFADVLQSQSPAAGMLRAMRNFLGENDMMAYLAMMAVRLIELHRVLKPTGSLYLHCDPTASHYLKILLDAVFGARNFRNEVIWKRTSAHSGANRFGPVHDTLLFYAKSDEWVWNKTYQPYDDVYVESFFTHKDADGRRWRRTDLTGPGLRKGDSSLPWKHYDPSDRNRHWQPPSYFYEKYKEITGDDLANYPLIQRLEKLDEAGLVHWPKKADGAPQGKRLLEDALGVPAQDVWDDLKPIHNMSQERLGYPTQKPVALLERILNASSNPGGVVLDPFCGCGTTVHAAQKLDRQWIGIDVTHLAIGLIEQRLRDAFDDVQFTTHGVPQDISGARDLAARGKDDPRYYYEFEKWAIALVGARPTKRTGDGGIDGNKFFGHKGQGHAIFEVKSGKVGTPQVARLRGAMERHNADVAVFLTLDPPNKGMIAEAAAAGFYEMEGFTPVPRVQIVTIEDAMKLRDRAVHLPAQRDDTYKKAPREEDKGRQGALDL